MVPCMCNLHPCLVERYFHCCAAWFETLICWSRIYFEIFESTYHHQGTPQASWICSSYYLYLPAIDIAPSITQAPCRSASSLILPKPLGVRKNLKVSISIWQIKKLTNGSTCHFPDLGQKQLLLWVFFLNSFSFHSSHQTFKSLLPPCSLISLSLHPSLPFYKKLMAHSLSRITNEYTEVLKFHNGPELVCL